MDCNKKLIIIIIYHVMEFQRKKVIVAFNASYRKTTSGFTLNDLHMIGPKIQENLFCYAFEKVFMRLLQILTKCIVRY